VASRKAVAGGRLVRNAGQKNTNSTEIGNQLKLVTGQCISLLLANPQAYAWRLMGDV